MIVEAFHRLGGVPAFARRAKQHPTQFYKLWARLLTREAADAAPAARVATEPPAGRTRQTRVNAIRTGKAGACRSPRP